MKNLLAALFLICGLAARAQTFTPIHNYQQPDGLSVYKYFGVPYGPTPVLNVTRTVPGALFYNTTDSSLYSWSGTFWARATGGVVISPSAGVDSLTISGNVICQWRAGVSTCYALDRFVTDMGLSADRFRYILYNFMGDSLKTVEIPHTIAEQGAGMVLTRRGDTINFASTGTGTGRDSFAFYRITSFTDSTFTFHNLNGDSVTINIHGGGASAGITALTGDVTASGTGSVVATIGPLKVLNSMIENSTIDLATKVTGTLPIGNGGTNATTPNGAFNNLVPSQTGNGGKYLITDGTNTSWGTPGSGTGTVTGITFGLGLTGGTITTSGTAALDTAGISVLSRQRAAATYEPIITAPNSIKKYWNGYKQFVSLDADSIPNAVTLTGTQTLTNKTFTSPIFNTTSTVGYVWTATNTSGAGAWSAAAGGAGGGAADSTLFWKLGGTWATAGAHFLGTRNNVSLRFRTNNTEFMMADSSSGNVAIGGTAVTTAKLYVNGTIWAQGPSGVGYRMTNGTAIRGSGTGGTIFYLDGNDNLTGTIDLRATTFQVEAALTANSVNSNGFVNAGYGGGLKVGGMDVVGYNTDSTLMRFNDNIYGKKIGVRADNTLMYDANTSPILWSNPVASSILELRSTTKGFLPPRMTKAQRDAIVFTGVGDGNGTIGTGYTNGAYPAMALTGGTGTGATAKITVLGNHITYISIISIGSGYTIGDVLTAAIPGGTGFTYTLTTLSASPGMTIYQTDNTPGQRVWNGTNWMKYTETAD